MPVRPASGVSLTALALTAAALAPGIGAAQDAPFMLDPIVVNAPEGAGASGAGLSIGGDQVASRTTIEREGLLGVYQGASLTTVLNSIAGVTTETVPGDPAIAVNIRGLQGNGRVVVTIDGARQNFSKSDHGANGTFYADPEMLRSVEVVRGPAGADAATGAIGGTLALRTIEAADLIAPDAVAGGTMRVRGGTLTEAPTYHLAFARELGARADMLLAFTRAQASDYEAGDGTKIVAEETELSGLGKVGFAPADGQEVTLSYSRIDSSYYTGFFSGIPRSTDLDTSNAVLRYLVDAVGPFATDVTLYRTVTDVGQQRIDPDSYLPVGVRRSYETTTTGVRGTAETGFALGPTEHALTFVLDAFHDKVTTDDANSIGGSLTPSGERWLGSLLVEDAIAFTDTTEAILGLRFDSYRLESSDGDVTDAQVSPSLTLQQAVGGGLVLYGTVAQAYRPPTLSEALVNGMHPEPADFPILPNPNLKPESAFTTEIGARLAFADLIRPGDALEAQLAVYRNDVDDFIGLVQKGTLFNQYMQYENIEKVRLEGVELEIAYDAERVFGSLSGQITQGVNRNTDEDISGIAPNRVVLTGGWRNPALTLEAGARLTLVGEREDGILSTDAWHTVDLFLTRALGERGSLGLALNNITNETYTQYLNTQPSPGFNALASLTVNF